MKSKLVGLVLGFSLALSAPTFCQEEQKVDARVLFLNGPLVQLDHGQESGVEPGDVVRLRPLGAAEVRGTVQTVQERTCLVQIPVGTPGVEIGTAAEITVRIQPSLGGDPADHLQDPDRRLPTTPPSWERQVEQFDREQPLLLELPTLPEERESHWSGNTYLLLDTIRERSAPTSTSTFARAGGSLFGENAFGWGGSLRLDLDFDVRAFRSGPGTTDRETEIRLERFAYGKGGDREHPLRWQVGRFLPSEFPEFGVLDGLEAVYRIHAGSHVGASLGFLPEPGQDYRTGEDFQLAASYRATLGDQNQIRWAVGLQKSWHEGVPDRDLAILKGSYRPSNAFSWTNSVWVDVYSSSDTAKDSGPEVSLLTTYLNWNRQDSGSSLGFRHWRLPQLLRFQGGTLTGDDLIQARTSRVDGSSWIRFGRIVRLSGRADAWKSEDQDGVGGDVRVDLDTLFGPTSRSWISLYHAEGSDNKAGGLRLGQGWSFGPGTARLTWDGARFRPRDDEGTLTQHDVRISWDYWSPAAWNLSVDVGRRFGDDQDSTSMGMYLQKTF